MTEDQTTTGQVAAAPEQPAQPKYPDALRVPLDWRGNSPDKFTRADAVQARCLPLLGVKPGEAHYHVQGQFGFIHVARKAHDLMLFPIGHRMEGRPRYDWEPRPEHGEGVFFGWLKPEAREGQAS